MVALALTVACQDTTSGPLPWTVTEVHKSVGLVGGHQQMDCADCHEGSGYTGVPVDCAACHLEQHSRVKDPDHVTLGYGTVCSECHTSRAWRPASIDHAPLGFPLEGAHGRLLCADCHGDGTYASLPEDCWSCHGPDFDASTDPDHTALDFSHECQTCHADEAWSPAVFDHTRTSFALDGAHRLAPCLSCHEAGYVATPTDCLACHAQDEPDRHFGPDCAACHTTAAWRPSTFDHERWFPLRSGAHRRYGSTCASCHLNAATYTTFTCTDCHDNEHTASRTDRQHREVRNYIYGSAACYDCHPKGRGEGDGGDDD